MRVSLKAVVLVGVAGTAVLLSPYAHAAGISLGLKGGLSLSNQTVQYPFEFKQDFDYRLGGAVFAFADFQLTSGISLAPTIGYNQKGSKDVDSLNGVMRYERDWRIDYLSAQIHVRALFAPVGKVSFYVLAGPRADFLLEAYWDLQFESGAAGDLPFDHGADLLKTTVYGAFLGLGTEIPLASRTALTLEGIYDLDISAARGHERPPQKVASIESIKHRTIQVLVGFKYGL